MKPRNNTKHILKFIVLQVVLCVVFGEILQLLIGMHYWWFPFVSSFMFMLFGLIGYIERMLEE